MPRAIGWVGQVAAAALFACIGGGALADGVILNGVSPYTIGRGGTNLAFADNGSMLFDNPGAMGFLEGESMFQIGATALYTEFSYSDLENDKRAQHQVYPLPEISYIHKHSDTWAYGVGVFSPAGFGAIYNLDGQGAFPGPQRYKSFGSLTKLVLGGSYTPGENVSFGATIGPGLSFVDLTGPYTLQGPSPYAGLPTLLDLSVDGVGLGWSAGVSVQLTETTTFGAAFQSQVEIDATGTADVVTPIGSTRYHADADIAWPRSAGGGLRQQIGDRHVLACDLIWFDWSSAFDTFDISLHSSTNPALPPLVEQFPLHWSDSLSTRVGYEYHRPNGHVARCGYTHHSSPIPAGTITPYIPAAMEHAFSVGYGWDWHCWQVNAAYMYTYGQTVHTPTSDFIGGDFDQSTNRDRTHAAGISFTRLIGR